MDSFADSAKADDSGDGLSMGNAKKHISAVLALLTDPITEEDGAEIVYGTDINIRFSEISDFQFGVFADHGARVSV